MDIYVQNILSGKIVLRETDALILIRASKWTRNAENLDECLNKFLFRSYKIDEWLFGSISN